MMPLPAVTLIVSLPAVPLTVAVSTALSPRPEPIAPSSLTATPASGRSVPLIFVVRAAQGLDPDPLDVVEVHDDTAKVAGEERARAVGGDHEHFIPAAAVENKAVHPGLAVDRVAACRRPGPIGRRRRRRPGRLCRCPDCRR